jgi:hypothetical protein
MSTLVKYGPAIVTVIHALFVFAGVYDLNDTQVPFLLVWSAVWVLYARRSNCHWREWRRRKRVPK